jgi:hypothetical protein
MLGSILEVERRQSAAVSQTTWDYDLFVFAIG